MKQTQTKLFDFSDAVARGAWLREEGDNGGDSDEETWVDGYEVCTFLKISERTLQRLRTKGLISYSIISGKTYYTIAEVKRMLNERLVKTNQEALDNLIESHKTYVEQRRNTRTDR